MASPVLSITMDQALTRSLLMNRIPNIKGEDSIQTNTGTSCNTEQKKHLTQDNRDAPKTSEHSSTDKLKDRSQAGVLGKAHQQNSAGQIQYSDVKEEANAWVTEVAKSIDLKGEQ